MRFRGMVTQRVAFFTLLSVCLATILFVGHSFLQKSQHKDLPAEVPVCVWDSLISGNDFDLYKGDTAYFDEGSLHNINGPAVLRNDGDIENWLCGQKFDDYGSFDTVAEAIRGVEQQCLSLKLIFDGDHFKAEGPSDLLASGEFRTSFNGNISDLWGPAIQLVDGGYAHYKDGVLTCDDGPAIVSSLGSKGWFKNNLPSRDDGPAIEFYDGTKWYMKDGKFHRIDGPAVIWGSRSNDQSEYWIDGKQFSEDEYMQKTGYCPAPVISDYSTLA